MSVSSTMSCISSTVGILLGSFSIASARACSARTLAMGSSNSPVAFPALAIAVTILERVKGTTLPSLFLIFENMFYSPFSIDVYR